MSVEYTTLNASDKRNVSHAINLKRKLVDLTKEFQASNSKIFSLVRENGGVNKGDDKIVYNRPQGKTVKFNLDKFKTEYPFLYTEFLEEVDGKSDYISYKLK